MRLEETSSQKNDEIHTSPDAGDCLARHLAATGKQTNSGCVVFVNVSKPAEQFVVAKPCE